MKTNYKGFEINVYREKCLAGYDLLYYSIFRESDGYELTSGYSEGDDTIKDFISYMKENVDDYLVNPDNWD